MDVECDGARVRYEARRALRLLVQEAKRQGCFEEVRRFPGVFAACALLDPVIDGAVGREIVTLQDIALWLGVLLHEA